MAVQDKRIDDGAPFDWGRASADYAKYRDIYPPVFYEKILERNLCKAGQNVLDVGTGTGVLPRSLYRYGASWTGIDASPQQIAQAKLLSKDMDIRYETMAAEALTFPEKSFDVVTACQCFFYFQHEKTALQFQRILRPGGRLLILYMAWLPQEDKIARESEALVLKYNPRWSGRGETMHPIELPDCYRQGFDVVYHTEYPLLVPFTRESWHGRIKACRGIGASLEGPMLRNWEQEHRALLQSIAPDSFEVPHYAAMTECKVKE